MTQVASNCLNYAEFTLALNAMEGYLVTGFFSFVAGIICAVWLAARAAGKKPPKIPGTAIPELGEGFDISKRYDLVYGGDYGAQFVERLVSVRILGYVGSEDDESVSKMYIRGRWLVVEFRDERKVYLMPRSIISLQESAES